MKAIHAAVAPGDGGRPQPGLSAVGALEAELDGLIAHRVSE
jgi:hypothetical protein